MRLLDYGLGEVLDRLSILALKISHATDLGKPTDHFTRERAKLLVQAQTRVVGKVFECYAELAVVNARLWHAEDGLRGLRKTAGPNLSLSANEAGAALQLAFEIQQLNDRRAALVAAINRESGDAAAEGEEKLYGGE